MFVFVLGTSPNFPKLFRTEAEDFRGMFPRGRKNMAEEVDVVAIRELLPFLSPDARHDLKFFAVDYILGLTGSESGKKFLKQNDEILKKLLDLTLDEKAQSSCRDSYLAIVNLSAEPVIADKLLEFDVIPTFLSYVLGKESQHADKVAMILSNLTRTEKGAKEVVKVTTHSKEIGLYKLVEVFCMKNYNPNANLNYLAPFLSNLTQLPEAREFILDRKRCVIQRMLTFTQFQDSLVRRGGVVAVLKNCCFETAYHDWLLSETVDILPHLLLPLAGPEELDEEEMEKLPPDLQYLGEEKERESDPVIRRMLLESLLQLCSTSKGRAHMKENNVYVILRELDKWEKDESVVKACRNVIHVLIGDEPEAGMENLRNVEIPENVVFDEEGFLQKN